MKLTEEERERLDDMSTEDLRIEVEMAVRKRKKIKEDKSAYVKACNDILKLQEAKMEYAVEVLERREATEAPAPFAGPPGPPPPVAH